MSTTQHTPGPWSRNIRAGGKYPTVFAGRNTHVAVVQQRPTPEETEANIDLIAAAPDLLAALEEHDELHFATLDLLKRVDGPESMNLRAALYELMDKRHAAIAAARGGAQSRGSHKPMPTPDPVDVDVSVTTDSSLCLFSLDTDAAREWWDEKVGEHLTWGGAHVVERRYAHDLAAEMLFDGLTVTVDGRKVYGVW